MTHTGHIESLKLFRDSVVKPSLDSINTEINRLEKSDDPAASFLVDEYAELFQMTVEGYVIAVQSMWERGLRAMLIRREEKLTSQPNPATLERATWGVSKKPNLREHFMRLMGIPLEVFDSYVDLDFLQCLASAIRHGDGASAQKVHEQVPNLWFNWIAPGEEIVASPFRIVAPQNGKKYPPFDSITLPEAVLSQMIQSIICFWEDIENMRCNSFKIKHESVVVQISNWKKNRPLRRGSRFWHSADGAFPRSPASI